MPCQLRIQYPGAMYHVMSRGNRRDNISLDEVDCHDFLKTLAEACQKTGWQVHAYCLMGNHYHLVLETPNADLVAGMACLQSTYTTRLIWRAADLLLRRKGDPAKLTIGAGCAKGVTKGVSQQTVWCIIEKISGFVLTQTMRASMPSSSSTDVTSRPNGPNNDSLHPQ